MEASNLEFNNWLRENNCAGEFESLKRQLTSKGYSKEDAYEIAKQKIVSMYNAPAQAPDTDKGKRKRKAKSSINRDDFTISSALFEGKPPIGSREIIEWVFNNIDVADIKAVDAPSSGAWSLLCRVRADAELEKEFYRTLWPKLLPTKGQLDELANKFSDNGERQIALIERLEKAMQDEESVL